MVTHMNDMFFQDLVLDHFKYPRHKKTIEGPTFSSGQSNPSCGDKITFEGIIKDGVITEIGFSGSGCVISQASASMLAEKCIGKSIDEVLALSKDDITAMLNTTLGPNRLKCALLSLQALKTGLQSVK